MTKINETAPSYSASLLKKIRKGGGDSNFGDFLAAATDETESSGNVSTTSPLIEAGAIHAFLSLQEVSEEETRRQRSLQQGKQSLDVLEQLRREILTGRPSSDMIHRMQQQVEQMRQHAAPDPHLQEIMDEIELRLAVEAAKMEMHQPPTAS
jgi:hypothetical protein